MEVTGTNVSPWGYPHNTSPKLLLPKDMALSASQIRLFLKVAREATGLTQEKAARRADVGLGVVTNAEQTGSMMAENFLALVIGYGAEEALVNQIRKWRAANGQTVAASGDTPKSTAKVKHRLPEGQGMTVAEAKRQQDEERAAAKARRRKQA